MEQINTYAVYLLGKWMDSVFLHARFPLSNNVGAWQSLRALLEAMTRSDGRFKLNESAAAATNLRAGIDAALALYRENPDTVLTDGQVAAFNNAWGNFEQALALDLSRAPIFFVTQKGIYSTPWLINSAEFAFTPEVFVSISEEARNDINQAGRCLAFEIATGAGYHALRGTEKVLREYYELVTGKSPGKKTMGALIDGLDKDARADKKTVAVVDQIRDLHRNPISHPNIFLTFSEAMELFDICKGAISAMARQMIALKAKHS